MGEYLKLFKTEADYEAASEKPTVSHIIETVDVKIESSIHDYSKEYLTFIAIEDGTFKFSGNGIYYSLNSGKTWTSLASNVNTPTVTAGNEILWKGNVETQPYTGLGKFSSTNRYDVKGNIMSIIYSDNFKDKTDLNGAKFMNLFSGDTNIIDAENLIMPATALTEECYTFMFRGCESLTKAPTLPATELAEKCYRQMFSSCKSLVKVQEELPATVLKNSCYSSMFSNCISLEIAPNIKATRVEGVQDHMYDMFFKCTSLVKAPDVIKCINDSGYPSYQMCAYMFYGCTSLEIAPVINIKNIGSDGSALSEMFEGCTKLRYIKALFTTTPVRRNSYRWVMNVAANGVFVKSRDATWNVTASSSNNYIGVPAGWTIEYADE